MRRAEELAPIPIKSCATETFNSQGMTFLGQVTSPRGAEAQLVDNERMVTRVSRLRKMISGARGPGSGSRQDRGSRKKLERKLFIFSLFHVILTSANSIRLELYFLCSTSGKSFLLIRPNQSLINGCLAAATNKTKLIVTVTCPFPDRPWLPLYFFRYHETIKR